MFFTGPIFSSKSAQFWWHWIIVWACSGFYHFNCPNIRATWDWRIYSWHWNGPTKILRYLAVITVGSPCLDIALVVATTFNYYKINCSKFNCLSVGYHHSIGAALTHFQVLSAESRKYFRNAIILSGSAENLWAISDDDHLKRAFNMAQELGETITDHQELVEFLKTVAPEKLYRFADGEKIRNVLPYFPIAPIIESVCDSIDSQNIPIILIKNVVRCLFRNGCETAIFDRKTEENLRNGKNWRWCHLYFGFNCKLMLYLKYRHQSSSHVLCVCVEIWIVVWRRLDSVVQIVTENDFAFSYLGFNFLACRLPKEFFKLEKQKLSREINSSPLLYLRRVKNVDFTPL